MPWTYPPQFDLLVAPFALLPAGVAYLLFVTATLTIYLLTLRAIAGKNFAQIMVSSFLHSQSRSAADRTAFLQAH
ncbi:glycosyltransferase 87 family protein [Bradyrhizobium sp. Pa8]|uniref:glycosyltransferase 87 family protein n=1 Tax=Bradyrhizobium sp. Pa8 TaxID=3386552 RepID=UPI00403F5FCA